MACKVNNVMSILFSGQELTAVFFCYSNVLHILFRTAVKHYLYFSLDFKTGIFFWAFKMGK